MDQTTLVENQIDDGRELIDELKNHLDVSAAFWLYAGESGRWYLYLVADAVEKLGSTEVYKVVHRTMRRMPDSLWIDPFAVKVVSPNDPTATAILDFLARSPAPQRGARVRGTYLGRVFIENAFIYPSISPP